jgi:hypothetical protein
MLKTSLMPGDYPARGPSATMSYFRAFHVLLVEHVRRATYIAANGESVAF